MENKTSKEVRPDNSKNEIRGWKAQGYTKVVFRSNPSCCSKQCRPLNGNIYSINDLLTFDRCLWRTSHVNCLCRFEPYGQKAKPVISPVPPVKKPISKPVKRPVTTPTVKPTTTTTPTTPIQPTPTTPKPTLWQKIKENVNPMKWINKLRGKSSSDYKNKIMREAKRIQASKDYKNSILRRAQWISKR